MKRRLGIVWKTYRSDTLENHTVVTGELEYKGRFLKSNTYIWDAHPYPSEHVVRFKEETTKDFEVAVSDVDERNNQCTDCTIILIGGTRNGTVIANFKPVGVDAYQAGKEIYKLNMLVKETLYTQVYIYTL